MSVVDLTKKARDCRKNGRLFEAIYNYDLAIAKYQELLQSNESEESGTLQKIYDDILECQILKEKLRNIAEGQFDGGRAVQNLVIKDDSTGYSYKKLIGPYLNESVTEVLIEEPYLAKNFQCVNLISLFELLVKECELVFVQLITKQFNKEIIWALKDALQQKNIFLFIKEDFNLHDRKIILNNGYKIKIGRGLHYFKKPEPFYTMGICDYDYRRCYQTNFEIIRRKHWLIEKVSSNFYFRFIGRKNHLVNLGSV